MIRTIAVASLLTAATPAWALNYYELEVYPYRTAAKGELELENSSAYTLAGTRAGDENRHIFRNTFEVDYGLSNRLEFAAYGDFFRDPGTGRVEFGGQRYHLRTRFFQKGELPVDLGAYVELEMPKHDPDTREADVKGIIEKDFGKWTVDLNPGLEKVLSGSNANGGWDFHYAAGLVYRMNETVQPRLDFFGDLGPINHVSSWNGQEHLISPAVDVNFTPTFHVLAGAAFGVTNATEQRLLRLKMEWEFY